MKTLTLYRVNASRQTRIGSSNGTVEFVWARSQDAAKLEALPSIVEALGGYPNDGLQAYAIRKPQPNMRFMASVLGRDSHASISPAVDADGNFIWS